MFVITYLALVEYAKTVFYKRHATGESLSQTRPRRERSMLRRAARFSRRHPVGSPAHSEAH